MAYTTINKPSEYFNTVLYTGDGTTNQTKNITFGFQPDLSWFKSRDAGNSHILVDAVRGGTKYLISESSGGEGTLTATQLFTATGMTISNDASSANSINSSGSTKVSWGWKANGSGVSNTQGDITSTVSASTTSGFSIVTYTGTGANATVGHGLGSAPKMVIVKSTSAVGDWLVGHSGIGFTERILLNTAGAKVTDSTSWQDTAPSSSVFSIGTNGACNTSSVNYVAYCFAEKKGFSKFGSYTGNGSDLFIYTGFKPAFLICKRTNIADNWKIVDNKRSPFNVVDDTLAADSAGAEASPEGGITIDFLSNGFAFKSMSNVAFNGSGDSYIYIAFAENPLVGTNGVPATAR